MTQEKAPEKELRIGNKNIEHMLRFKFKNNF